MVRHEEGIELRGFQLLDKGLQMREVKIRVGIRTGITPRPGMQAYGTHEGGEVQRLCHGEISVRLSVSLQGRYLRFGREGTMLRDKAATGKISSHNNTGSGRARIGARNSAKV
jgi:hypothetical protein